MAARALSGRLCRSHAGGVFFRHRRGDQAIRGRRPRPVPVPAKTPLQPLFPRSIATTRKRGFGGDAMEIETGPGYRDTARYPIDFFIVHGDALHIVPAEALATASCRSPSLAGWRARMPDGATLPAELPLALLPRNPGYRPADDLIRPLTAKDCAMDTPHLRIAAYLQQPCQSRREFRRRQAGRVLRC